MEDPPGDESESPHAHPPHSHREIHSVHLELSLASSDVEQKRILDLCGMTIEEFTELFEHHSGSAGPDDD